MRRTLFLLCSFVFSSLAFAANSTMQGNSNEADQMILTQEVCKFSLSSTTGTIKKEAGNYKSGVFRVQLSCPQEREVNATVSLSIDGEVVANKVVSIKKNEKESADCYIYVGSEYEGKKYKLTVE